MTWDEIDLKRRMMQDVKRVLWREDLEYFPAKTWYPWQPNKGQGLNDDSDSSKMGLMMKQVMMTAVEKISFFEVRREGEKMRVADGNDDYLYTNRSVANYISRMRRYNHGQYPSCHQSKLKHKIIMRQGGKEKETKKGVGGGTKIKISVWSEWLVMKKSSEQLNKRNWCNF